MSDALTGTISASPAGRCVCVEGDSSDAKMASPVRGTTSGRVSAPSRELARGQFSTKVAARKRNLYCDSFRLVIEEPSRSGQTTNAWALLPPLENQLPPFTPSWKYLPIFPRPSPRTGGRKLLQTIPQRHRKGFVQRISRG